LLEGAATFLEKLPGFSLRSGLILAIVGGVVQGAIWLGIIERTALGGYVDQVAPVLWVGGLAMVAAAALIEFLSWLATFRTMLANRKNRLKTRDRLIGNIAFLDEETRLLLLMILQMPLGRIKSLGDTPPFASLYELNLVVSESFGLVVITGVPTGMMKIAPEVYAERDNLIPQLADELTKRFDVDVRVEANAARILKERHEVRKRQVL